MIAEIDTLLKVHPSPQVDLVASPTVKHFASECVLFTLGAVHCQAIVRLKPIAAANTVRPVVADLVWTVFVTFLVRTGGGCPSSESSKRRVN